MFLNLPGRPRETRDQAGPGFCTWTPIESLKIVVIEVEGTIGI